jgi:hypothetical protein
LAKPHLSFFFFLPKLSGGGGVGKLREGESYWDEVKRKGVIAYKFEKRIYESRSLR